MKKSRRICSLLLAFVLMLSLLPGNAIAYATDTSAETPAAEQTVDETNPETSDATEAPAASEETEVPAASEETEAPAEPAPLESPAFSESADVDGMTVYVDAEEGAFPEGAKLSVKKVRQTAAIKNAVAEAREDDQTVVESYTFDIQVLDENGEELQPVEGKKVNVRFAMAEVADANLETAVYHHDDEAKTAEALNVVTTTVDGEDVALVETDGFSYYTVEFTYAEKQYVLQGDHSVALSNILAAVGLTGEVENAKSSNSGLFAVAKADGVWTVTAKKAFHTDESLTVTIGGKDYVIKVTDAEGIQVQNTSTTTALTISFSANGGTGTMGSITVAPNTITSLPTCSFTAPSGKVRFAGWADAGDVDTLAALYGVGSGRYPVKNGGTVTLYAIWDDTPQALYDQGYRSIATDGAYGTNLVELTPDSTGTGYLISKYTARDANSTTGAVASPTKIYIPYEFPGGKRITGIGANAFKGTNITGVAFDTRLDGVNFTIGNDAFNTVRLSGNVTLPKGTTTIGQGAFNNNGGSITSVNFNDLSSLTSIGVGAFNTANLTDIDLSNTKLENIPSSAFTISSAFGTQINNLKLPSTLKSIQSSAFSNLNCNVVIPADVNSINEYAFSNASSAATVDVSGCSNWSTIYKLACTPNIIFPDDCYSAGSDFAFKDGTIYGMKKNWTGSTVTVPSTIGGAAVTALGYRSFSTPAFKDNVTSLTFAEGCGITNIPESTCRYAYKLKTVTFHSGINSISAYAFGNSKVETINWGGVQSIGYQAFINGYAGAALSLPKHITSIDSGAFSSNAALTEVTIGDSSGSDATTIANNAFSDNPALTTISIPGIDKPADGSTDAPWCDAPWGGANATVNWKNGSTLPINMEVVDSQGNHWIYNTETGSLQWFLYQQNSDGTKNDASNSSNRVNLTLPKVVYSLSDTLRTSGMRVQSWQDTLLRNKNPDYSSRWSYFGTVTIPEPDTITGTKYTTALFGGGRNINIDTVVFSDGWKEIGGDACFLSYLDKAYLPDSVTAITGNGFRWYKGYLNKIPPKIEDLTGFTKTSIRTDVKTEDGRYRVDIPSTLKRMANDETFSGNEVHIQQYRPEDSGKVGDTIPDDAVIAPVDWRTYGSQFILLEAPAVRFEDITAAKAIPYTNIYATQESYTWVKIRRNNGTTTLQSPCIRPSGDGARVDIRDQASAPADYDATKFGSWDSNYIYAKVTMKENKTYNVIIASNLNGTTPHEDILTINLKNNYAELYYDLNGGTADTEPEIYMMNGTEKVVFSTNSLLVGTPITVADPSTVSKSGYATPRMWSTDKNSDGSTGFLYRSGDTYELPDNGIIRLYPVWLPDEAQKINVTYAAGSHGKIDGAAADGKVTQEAPIATGADFELTDVTATPDTGYHIEGWYLGNEKISEFATLTHGVAEGKVKTKGTTREATEFTANFEPNTYTIKFASNISGASGSVDDIVATYDDAEAAPELDFGKNGYVATSWNTKADGTGTTYLPGAELKNLTTANNGTVRLYAQWDQSVEVSITGSTKTVTYTGAEQSLNNFTVSYRIGGVAATALPSGMNLTLSTSLDGAAAQTGADNVVAKGTTAGTYTAVVTASVTGTASGYAIGIGEAKAELVLTINPAKITITPKELYKTYGEAIADTDLTATVVGKPTAGVDPDYTVSWANPTKKNAGVYTLSVVADPSSTNNANYDITVQTANLTIEKRDITLKAKDAEKFFNAADPATYEVELASGTTLATDDAITDLKYKVSRESGENVGKYAINIEGLTNRNYNIDTLPGVFEIKKPEAEDALGLTVTAYSGAYDGKAHSVSVNLTIVNGTTLSYSTDGGTTWSDTLPTYTNATASAVTVKVKAHNPNYKDMTAEATVTISKKAATLNVRSASKVYGEEDPVFTATVSGLVAGESLEYALQRANATTNDVGTYAITTAESATQLASKNPNYSVTVNAGELTIKKATVTVTVEDAEKVYGAADPTFSYSVDGLQYSDTDADDLGVSVNRASGENVGSYDLTVTTDSTKNTNYNVKTVKGKLTITKRDVYITARDASKVYGQDDPTTFAVNESGLTGLPTGFTPAARNYTVTRANNTRNDVGEYAIKVNVDKANNPNYNIIVEDGTFTITPRPVSITVGNGTKVYRGAEPTAATMKAYATVEAFNGTSGRGIVSGDTLNFTVSRDPGEDVGSYTMFATPGDNPNYTVTTTNGTFTITANASVTITPKAVTITYGEDVPELTATVSGTKSGDTIDFELEYVNTDGTAAAMNANTGKLEAGAYTIKVKETPAALGATYTNYDSFVCNTATLTVLKKNVTVKAVDVSKVFGESDPTSGNYVTEIEGVVPGDDDPTFTVGRLSGQDGENVGRYTISVTPGTNKNYDVKGIAGKMTITPKAVTITVKENIDLLKKTYGQDDPDWTADAADIVDIDGAVTGTAVKYTVSRKSGNHVGEYAVKVTAAASENPNYTVTTVPGVFTIEPKAATITVSSTGTKVYGEADPTFKSDTYVTVTGVETGDTLNYTVAREAGQDVGTYPIHVTLGSNPDYDITVTEGSFEITKKAVTITAKNASKVYGDADPALTATVTGAKAGDTLIYTVARTEGENVNTAGYPITVTAVAADNPNYTVTTVGATFTITKKAITVKPDDATKVYGEADPTFTYTANGLVGADTISCTVNRDAGDTVGTYKLTIADGTWTNYTVTGLEGKFTITRKAVTITAGELTKTYGTLPTQDELDAVVEVEGAVPGDTLDYTVSTTANDTNKGVGTYPITVKPSTTADVNKNYVITTVKGELTIVKKGVTITAEDKTKVYGEADPAFTATVTGAQYGETLNYSLTRVAGEDYNVNGYAINVVAGENPNYSVIVKSGKLMINKAPAADLGLSAVGYEGIYDATEHTASAMAGIMTGTRFMYSTDGGHTYTAVAPSITNVGEQAFMVKAINNNYEDATASGTLRVTAKDVTVTSNNASKVYGEADPEFTATVTGNLNDDPIVYTLSRDMTHDDVPNSTYTITAAGAEIQGNYKVTFVSTGKLTIKKAAAEQLGLVVEDATFVYDSSNKNITATVDVNTDTTISYKVTGGEWTTTVPTLKDVGSQTVYVKAENPNYETQTATATLTITPMPVTVTINSGLTKVYDHEGTGTTEPDWSNVKSVSSYTTLNNDELDYTVKRESGEDVGEYAITATGKALQGNYEVTYETGVFTITKAEGALLGLKGGDTVTYDSKAHGPKAGVEVTNGTTIWYKVEDGGWTETAPSYVNAGTYPVSLKATNPNYKDAEMACNVIINPKEVDITAKAMSKTYGEADPDWSDIKAVSTVKGTLNDRRMSFERDESTGVVTVMVPIVGVYEGFDEFTYTVSRAGNENAGTYTITPTAEEGLSDDGTYAIQGNYKLNFHTAEYTINKKAIKIAAEDHEKIYGDDNPALSAVVTGTLHDDQVTYNVERGMAVVGVVDNSYETRSNEPDTVTVKVPGVGDPAEDTITFILTRAAGENVGEYVITPSNAVSTNYVVENDSDYTTATFTINPKEITVSATANEKTYGAADPKLGATANGLVTTTGSLSPLYIIGDPNEKGEYTVTASIPGINQRDTLTYVVKRVAGEDAGEYAISVTGEERQGNYTVTTWEDSTFTINPKEITVTADNVSKTYGEEDPELTVTFNGTLHDDAVSCTADGDTVTATVEGVGDPATDTITFTLKRDAGENANAYTISIDGEELQKNYKITAWNNGTFTINPKEITVTADNVSKTYGDADPELTTKAATLVKEGETYDLSEPDENGVFTVTVKAPGVEQEDVLTYTVTRAAGENAGEYTITAAGEARQGNYTVTGYVPSTFTIDPREITVAANDNSKIYGEADPALTATVTGTLHDDATTWNLDGENATVTVEGVGDPNPDTITFTLKRDDGENAGEYAITVNGTDRQGNYIVTAWENAVFTIQPKKITVTADDKTCAFRADAPAFTVTYTDTLNPELPAFIEGENETVLGGELEYTCIYDAKNPDPAGNYEIVPSGLTSNNYEITFANGTLTVTLPVDNNGDGTADTQLADITKKDDGTYTDGEGTVYYPIDTDSDNIPDVYVKATDTNPADGILEGVGDDSNTYAPIATGRSDYPTTYLPMKDKKDDGSFTGPDNETYIPVDTDGDDKADTSVPAKDEDGDGVYEDEDDNKYYPVDVDGDGNPDTYVPGEPKDDGTFTGPDGETYIPVDTDGDGKPDTSVPAEDKDGDGIYEDEDGNKYYPIDTDGDGKPDTYVPGKPSTDENGKPKDDGSFIGPDGETYIPVDTDGDGKPDTSVPAKDEDGDGVYEDKDGNKYYPVDTDGDGKPDTYVPGKQNTDENGEPKDDGSFIGPDGETYIPVDTDGDGKPDTSVPAEDKDGDGIYEDKGDNKYYPVDTDGDGNPDTYIPGKPSTDENGKPKDDGSFIGPDGETYIPVDTDGDGKPDTSVPAKDEDGDGVYEDKDGNKYYPIDTDGDGKPDTYVPGKPSTDENGEPKDDGSFIGPDGETYIPVDTDGDGKADTIIPAKDSNSDGLFEGEDGTRYYPVDVDGDGTIDFYLKEGSYFFAEGADQVWYKGSNAPLSITVKRDDKVNGDTSFQHFRGLMVDGVMLKRDVDYTAREGSTIVTFKPEFLETLSVGEHTVTFIYDDCRVTTNLIIKDSSANPAPNGTNGVKTGDESNIVLWISLAGISTIGLATVVIASKKRRYAGKH